MTMAALVAVPFPVHLHYMVSSIEVGTFVALLACTVVVPMVLLCGTRLGELPVTNARCSFPHARKHITLISLLIKLDDSPLVSLYVILLYCNE